MFKLTQDSKFLNSIRIETTTVGWPSGNNG